MSSTTSTPLPACASAPVVPPRMDIYVGIHKALRAQMMDTLQAVGRVDVHDAADLHAVCARVLVLADTCTSHLAHENDFVHPAMEARQPGASAQIAVEHDEHRVAIAQLRAAVTTLRAASSGPAQEQAALQLYHRLSLFVADNLIHMHAEETQHNQVLWSCYSDAELQALEGRIVASQSPVENLHCLRWMVPAMTPSERATLLVGIQKAAPPAVLMDVLVTVQPHLSPADWAKLGRALAPASVPVPVPMAA